MTRWRVIVAVASALLLAAGSGAAPVTTLVSAQGAGLAEPLSRYSKGEWAGVEALPPLDLKWVRSELTRLAPDLIASNGSIRARHLLAAFSAEIAARSATRANPVDFLELVEVGCALVRGHSGARDPFDDVWFSVYLANVEAVSFFNNPLPFHLEHVKERSPNHPRLLPSRAFAIEREMSMWGDGDFARILPGGKPAALNAFRGTTSPDAGKDAIRIYKTLLNDASFGSEARARLGRIQVGLGQFREALATLAAVPREGDSGLQYWSALFRGIAKRELGELPAAIDEFRDALKTAPRASSATTALAGALFLNGDLEGSRRVTSEYLRSGPGADPWYSYSVGSFRRIDLLLDAMRNQLK